MKITKSVLSIFAIAISSSAFASAPSETDYVKITADAYARATHSLRGESGSADSKNESTLILIKSNSNTAYIYNVYSKQESKTVQDLSDKLSKIGLSDEVIYGTIKAQLTEDRKDSAYVAQLNNVREIDSSLRAQYADSAKNIIENNLSSDLNEANKQIYSTSQLFAYSKALHDRNGWASVISYLYGQEINKDITSKEFNNVVASLQKYEEEKTISGFNAKTAVISEKIDISHDSKELIGFNISPIEEITVAAPARQLLKVKTKFVEFFFPSETSAPVESNNAIAISEFNTLQELALKESDPSVKNVIKQAADLKLAGYTK